MWVVMARTFWPQSCTVTGIHTRRYNFVSYATVSYATLCEWPVPRRDSLHGSVADAGAWLLSLFLSSAQMTHQRNLGYGFCGQRALLLFATCCDRGFVGLHGPSNGSFQSFLPFDGPCSVSGLSAIVGCAFRGWNESQVILGRFLCVHMLL